MTGYPIADFTKIEYSGNELKCPRCGRLRRALWCIGGGETVCRDCHLEQRGAEVVAEAGKSARRADERNVCP